MGHKLLAFNTTYESLKAEDILISKGVLVNPIPIPRHIRADCSLGLRIKKSEIDMCMKVLQAEKIEYQIHDAQ